MIKPTWETPDGSVKLCLGDCLTVLPTLEPGSVDAVVTDPPYGVGLDYATYDDSLENWRKCFGFVADWGKLNASVTVMPSCQIRQLAWIYANHAPDWLMCWYKGSTGCAAHVGFNDWEPMLVYGKPPKCCVHDYMAITPDSFDNGHPCPKPVAWATWIAERFSWGNDTILDPFMGSGTTGVAAVRLGRKFIGIEIDPTYFEIARKRIEDAVTGGPLFRQPPPQELFK